MSWFFQDDPHLVVLSFTWIVAVIIVGEVVRRLLDLPPDVSRKFIHILVAAWALPTALLFENPLWAAACPLVFVGLNALSYKFRLMDSIEEDGEGSPGTIYFPLSFALVILVLWPFGGRAASVAGLYAMGFGDALASVIGRRYGKHRYHGGRGAKSYQGSLAMFVFSLAAILLGTYPLLGFFAWIPALGAALVATLAEAPAGRGTDNLTVPVFTAVTFLLLEKGLG